MLSFATERPPETMLSLGKAAGGTGFPSPNVVLKKTPTRPWVYSSQPSAFATLTSAAAIRLKPSGGTDRDEQYGGGFWSHVFYLSGGERWRGVTVAGVAKDGGSAPPPAGRSATLDYGASCDRRHGDVHALRVVRLSRAVARVEVTHRHAVEHRRDRHVWLVRNEAPRVRRHSPLSATRCRNCRWRDSCGRTGGRGSFRRP